MKPKMRMDYMVAKVAAFNELTKLTTAQWASETEREFQKKKKKKTGKGEKDGFIGAVVNEMFFRANGVRQSGILGITHVSDGHPQEELTPDFQLFRALQHNNATWTLYWPDLII